MTSNQKFNVLQKIICSSYFFVFWNVLFPLISVASGSDTGAANQGFNNHNNPTLTLMVDSPQQQQRQPQQRQVVLSYQQPHVRPLSYQHRGFQSSPSSYQQNQFGTQLYPQRQLQSSPGRLYQQNRFGTIQQHGFEIQLGQPVGSYRQAIIDVHNQQNQFQLGQPVGSYRQAIIDVHNQQNQFQLQDPQKQARMLLAINAALVHGKKIQQEYTDVLGKISVYRSEIHSDFEDWKELRALKDKLIGERKSVCSQISRIEKTYGELETLLDSTKPSAEKKRAKLQEKFAKYRADLKTIDEQLNDVDKLLDDLSERLLDFVDLLSFKEANSAVAEISGWIINDGASSSSQTEVSQAASNSKGKGKAPASQ